MFLFSVLSYELRFSWFLVYILCNLGFFHEFYEIPGLFVNPKENVDFSGFDRQLTQLSLGCKL